MSLPWISRLLKMSGIRLLRSTVAICYVYCGEQDETGGRGEWREVGGVITDEQHLWDTGLVSLTVRGAGILLAMLLTCTSTDHLFSFHVNTTFIPIGESKCS